MKAFAGTIGWIIVALIAGAALGLAAPATALAFTPVAKWVLQLIKAAATPLVFFAVLEAILRFRVAGADFLKLLAVALINATFAIGIGLAVANLFEPGRYLKPLMSAAPATLHAIDFGELLAKQLPTSIVQPFADNSIMPLVLIAIAFGFAWRRVRLKQDASALALMDKSEVLVSVTRDLCETLLIWIVKLVPFAVFAASAKVTAEHGLQPFTGLGQYVALCLLGMAIHVLFTYSAWLLLFARLGLGHFWRHAIEPALYAFSVNSSLVALPLTLRALDRLGISRRASTLAACVGTNLNNDGIILYEGFTLLALAQASGIDMSLAMQVFAALYCVVAAMGVAGVPEAGVVALTLVLGGLGLPTEALALLLSVDWIIARARSLLNTTSDMVGSTVLHRWLQLTSPKS
ncbi:MAG: dicarboxylate/amino acid:cation symporter [Porticoccaceae bacterium]